MGSIWRIWRVCRFIMSGRIPSDQFLGACGDGLYPRYLLRFLIDRFQVPFGKENSARRVFPYISLICWPGLRRRRGWRDPSYETYKSNTGSTCVVSINGREYQMDFAYEPDGLAQENAAMRAFHGVPELFDQWRYDCTEWCCSRTPCG